MIQLNRLPVRREKRRGLKIGGAQIGNKQEGKKKQKCLLKGFVHSLKMIKIIHNQSFNLIVKCGKVGTEKIPKEFPKAEAVTAISSNDTKNGRNAYEGEVANATIAKETMERL
ncbi:MAG: hypothetical protein SFY68_09815 [Candidatus Sumerlaeia bacterium]|nr:hypothetical protein [Candidatus Sumerlaeia bacterium]